MRPLFPRGGQTVAGFTLLELLTVIVILAILLAIAIPQFLQQPIKAQDAKAKSFLTLAWQDLTIGTTSDDAGFGTASELLGDLRYDEPGFAVQVVSDCSPTTMASYSSGTVVFVRPQTNAAAVTMCIRSDSGHIFELIAPPNGADPTIVLLSELTGTAPVNLSPPTITGDVRTGQRLTGNEGGWESDPPPTYSYQWQRCNQTGGSCTNISGAIQNTYLVRAADYGFTFRIQVTAANPYGSATAQSGSTGTSNTNLAGLPQNTVIPQITGQVAQTQTVTGTNGTWTGVAPISYSYQWLHSTDGGSTWLPINGATSVSYTIPAGEVGNELEFEVIATNVDGEQDAYSAATAPVIPPPVNTSVPTIGGTPQDSQLLTAGAGTWQYSPTSYTYQWQYSTNGGSTWSNINGATNNTYTVPYSTYDGDKLRVQVTATNGAGSTLADSAATTVVVPVAPSNTAAPAVSGGAQVGQVLSSTTGSWNGTPTITYSYHWQTSANGTSGWTNLSGATSSTYAPQSSDAGDYLRVEVTANNSAGSTFADSAATSQVLSSIPVGAVIPYAGQTPVPTGWALADGSCGYTSASYPDLWTAIGTTYGGTGSSNFCLPDMRGKMALGKAASGTGSSLGATGGALDQTGIVSPFGAVTENYSWTETPPNPNPIAHSHSMPGSGHLSNNQWPNFSAWEAQPSTTGTSCCGTGSPVDSLASASESWTTNASGTITASASFTPQASYSVSNPPYTVVRYLVSVLKTASTPCGALWGYGAAAAPSGAQLANGAAATGSLTSCLDAAFAGNVPDLRGKIPVGLTNSGSAATLAASGGSIDQTISGTLTAAATQTTITPAGWSDTMTEDSHTHTYSGVRRSDAGQGGNANGTASNSSAPTVGANSNAGAVYTSNVYSPGALATSGAGAQSPSSSSFNTAFETLNWVAYTSASYAPATGTITGYAGTGAPSGWLLADGSCYSTSGSYASLYAVIGYTYGGSSGSFCVPDLRGAFALGKATAGTASSLGANGGTLSPAPQLTFSGWTPQLTVPTHNFLWSVPAHTHRVAFSGSVTLGNAGGFIGSLRDGTVTSASTGGGSVSTSVNSYVVNATDAVAGANSAPPVAPPPFLAVMYIVKD